MSEEKKAEERELKIRSKTESSRLPTCNFFNELEFLRDILMNKPTDSNLNSTRPSFNDNDRENTTLKIQDKNFSPKRTTKRDREDGSHSNLNQVC